MNDGIPLRKPWRKEKTTDDHGKIVPLIVEPSNDTRTIMKFEGPAVIEGLHGAKEMIEAKAWVKRPLMIRRIRTANPVIDNNISDYVLEELHKQVLDHMEDPIKNRIAFSELYAMAASESAQKAGYKLTVKTAKTNLKKSKPSRKIKQFDRGRPRKNRT